MYYHYSNQQCQEYVVNKTINFPINPNGYDIYSVYSDRLRRCDKKRYRKACRFIEKGKGDQGWSYKVENFNSSKLKNLGRIVFGLKNVDHVKFVHYFNVSSGYNCPLIIGLVKK
jgi:hypothetical protein